MPSPFPGMDPFIEGQCWADFHQSSITTIREQLVPQVLPKYVVEVAERVRLETVKPERSSVVIPDLSVLKTSENDNPDTLFKGTSTDQTAVMEPELLTLPETVHVTESFLQVRQRQDMEVVTIVEVLSPTNKSPSDGRQEYLAKRAALLHTSVHLVELDLLRGGRRLPTQEELPAGDFFAFVCRREHRPHVEVFRWALEGTLPAIPIPLADDDDDVFVNLQTTLNTVYDRAGYQFLINYQSEVTPSLDERRQQWVQKILREF